MYIYIQLHQLKLANKYKHMLKQKIIKNCKERIHIVFIIIILNIYTYKNILKNKTNIYNISLYV